MKESVKIYKLNDGDKARIESRINKNGPNGCWLWTGKKSGDGYGHLKVQGTQHTAHRLTYTMYVGEIPAGKVLMHSCDNPICVKPEHLTPGTQAQNIQDAVQKGRIARGTAHGLAVLTEQQVYEIRALVADGTMLQYTIAYKYDVSRQLVSAIHHRKIWTHLPEQRI